MSKNPYFSIPEDHRHELRDIWLGLTTEQLEHLDRQRYGLIRMKLSANPCQLSHRQLYMATAMLATIGVDVPAWAHGLLFCEHESALA